MQVEFNTNVPDKDERKKARRQRIDKRYEEKSRELGESGGDEKGANRTGGQQVADSLLHLDRRKHTGLSEVTDLRARTDINEANRRTEEDNFRKDRLGKLQQEAFSSAKANAAIEMRWAELMNPDLTPAPLAEEMKRQQGSCVEVIKSKDELIVEFQRQLRAKDEEYVRALRQQAEDIEGLLQRIRKEFKELQGEYDKELEKIEDAYNDERERTISNFVGEIDRLFEHRRNKEVFYKETKQKREDQYQMDLEDLITKGASQYNKLKIELEMNIQTLKEQLEAIRATYQLNTEKLDYNYRVLTELDVEKNAELARYKRRLTKLKDQLSTLVTKYNETSNHDKKTNNELTEDYRSLTRKYKDLQAKFRHFEVSDTNKYDEVWTMHEDEAKDLVDKLLKADKIITEYQMGWTWKAPDMYALQKVLGKHGNLAQSMADEMQKAEGAGAEAAAPQKDSAKKKTEGEMVSGARIRGMLRLLSKEAGFLINPEVQQSLESLPETEADVEQAEHILKALGIKSEEKLASLSRYFFKENKTAQMLAAGKVEEVEEAEHELQLQYPVEDIAELRDMISAEDVVDAVRNFLEDVSAEAAPTSSAPPSAGGPKSADDDRIGQKRLNSMRNFWQQLGQVVSDDSVEVWEQMEKNYSTLKELLIKRSKSISEVDTYNRRNAELKNLLNQYLGDANVNHGMQVPPAQVMRVRDVGTGKGRSGKPGFKGDSNLLSKTS